MHIHPFSRASLKSTFFNKNTDVVVETETVLSASKARVVDRQPSRRCLNHIRALWDTTYSASTVLVVSIDGDVQSLLLSSPRSSSFVVPVEFPSPRTYDCNADGLFLKVPPVSQWVNPAAVCLPPWWLLFGDGGGVVVVLDDYYSTQANLIHRTHNKGNPVLVYYCLANIKVEYWVVPRLHLVFIFEPRWKIQESVPPWMPLEACSLPQPLLDIKTPIIEWQLSKIQVWPCITITIITTISTRSPGSTLKSRGFYRTRTKRKSSIPMISSRN